MTHAAPSLIAADTRHQAARRRVVALAGNPNVGKTTVFNQLTGLRQKIANYAGVTVEHKVGYMDDGRGTTIEITDVPGIYSLNPRSVDEEIAYRALIGAIDGVPPPDLIVCLVDASNLERNLYLVSQVLDLGRPTIVALNMIDAAEEAGLAIHAERLGKGLGVPVIPMTAADGVGVPELREAIRGPLPECPPRRWQLEPRVAAGVDRLAEQLSTELPQLSAEQRFCDALRALTTARAAFFEDHHTPAFWEAVRGVRDELRSQGISCEPAEVIARYAWIDPVGRSATERLPHAAERTLSDRIDAVLTHRIVGPLCFLLVLALIFQAVFSWAVPATDLIGNGVGAIGDWLVRNLPAGPLRSMLVDGAVAGVGAVLVFLPQILILFFFLGVLEDTGYMARAAFIMDRLLHRVGLSGRSVVPLLSSFACAIPGIMATRTIDSQRDRLVTIMIAPLMTCSARLPVYALLIGAFIPAGRWLGFWSYQGLTLFMLYLLGIAFAVTAAWVLKRYVIRGPQILFVMELPPYRMPRWRDLVWRLWERSRLFVARAGTIIFAISIVLWFLASYPAPGPDPALAARRAVAAAGDPVTRAAEIAAIDNAEATRRLEHSLIGRAGRLIEPALEPLGFNWKIGIALISSFAAREVAVSTLATIYSVGDADETSFDLRERLRADRHPDTGAPVFTPLVAASLMMFYVLGLQCMSTVAVAKRETNTWRWPLIMLGYMTGLAYVASLVVFQGGRALGLA